ncbi:MAG: LysR family transcriptional regulator [Gammaproteobacteria bacterium]|nr:LysR family transcriptional regulator [Gammaproteobacteria bacterium]
MDLRRLRTLIAVADWGSVSEAARRLHITQPALSRRIKEFEAELGVKLFERVGRGLVPTGEGEELLQHGRGLLDQVEALEEHARLLAHGEAGVLRIGATPQTIESLLAPFVHSYQELHKHVSVRLVEGGGAEQLDFLRRGQVHLAITAAPGDPALFVTQPLGEVILLAAHGPRLRLGKSNSKRLELTALADVPLLLLSRGFASRELFEAACRLADFRSDPYMESTAPHTLLALAEAGLGVAILPSNVRLVGWNLRKLRLTHQGEELRLPFGITWSRRRRLPRYAEAFVRELAHLKTDVTEALRNGALKSSGPGPLGPSPASRSRTGSG